VTPQTSANWAASRSCFFSFYTGRGLRPGIPSALNASGRVKATGISHRANFSLKSALIADLTEHRRLSFFCRSFSWALFQANSCVRQLRGFCFPGSSPNIVGPSHKAAARWKQKPSFLGAPGKWGRKRRFTKCLTYMLSGIASGCGSLADAPVIRASSVSRWPFP